MVGVGRVRRRTRDQFSQRRRGMCRNLRNLRTSSLCGAGTLGTLGSGASHVHAMGDAAASVAQVSVTRSLRSKTDDQLHMRCGWFVRTSVCSPQPDGVAKQKCTLLVLGGGYIRATTLPGRLSRVWGSARKNRSAYACAHSVSSVSCSAGWPGCERMVQGDIPNPRPNYCSSCRDGGNVGQRTRGTRSTIRVPRPVVLGDISMSSAHDWN